MSLVIDVRQGREVVESRKKKKKSLVSSEEEFCVDVSEELTSGFHVEEIEESGILILEKLVNDRLALHRQVPLGGKRILMLKISSGCGNWVIFTFLEAFEKVENKKQLRIIII